jgi:hypothetical protein
LGWLSSICPFSHHDKEQVAQAYPQQISDYRSCRAVPRLRTKLLLCGAALAPASVVLWRMDEAALIREAQGEGSVTAWVDPSFLIYGMFGIGLICFLGFVTSLILDLRRVK